MMNRISFDPLRTMNLPGISAGKPDHYSRDLTGSRQQTGFYFLNRERISRAIMETLVVDMDIRGPDTPLTPRPTLQKAA